MISQEFMSRRELMVLYFAASKLQFTFIGCKAINVNFARNIRDEDLQDCCWICEGWSEHSLTWEQGKIVVFNSVQKLFNYWNQINQEKAIQIHCSFTSTLKTIVKTILENQAVQTMSIKGCFLQGTYSTFTLSMIPRTMIIQTKKASYRIQKVWRFQMSANMTESS